MFLKWSILAVSFSKIPKKSFITSTTGPLKVLLPNPLCCPWRIFCPGEDCPTWSASDRWRTSVGGQCTCCLLASGTEKQKASGVAYSGLLCTMLKLVLGTCFGPWTVGGQLYQHLKHLKIIIFYSLSNVCKIFGTLKNLILRRELIPDMLQRSQEIFRRKKRWNCSIKTSSKELYLYSSTRFRENVSSLWLHVFMVGPRLFIKVEPMYTILWPFCTGN